MCHVLGIKSNNYYSYQKRKSSKSDNLAHQGMIELIKDIAKFSGNTYGARRIQKVLNTLSLPVSRRKTAKLMREVNVWARYKRILENRLQKQAVTKIVKLTHKPGFVSFSKKSDNHSSRP